MAADGGNIQEFGCAFHAEEVIGVDGAPNFVHARPEYCLRLIDRNADAREEIYLQRHDFLQIRESSAFRVMDENAVDPRPFLAQTIDEQQFRCLDVDADKNVRKFLRTVTVDDPTIAVGVPGAFSIKEFAVFSLKFFLFVFVLLQDLLDLLSLAGIMLHAEVYSRFEKFLELHSGPKRTEAGAKGAMVFL